MSFLAKFEKRPSVGETVARLVLGLASGAVANTITDPVKRTEEQRRIDLPLMGYLNKLGERHGR